MSAAEKMQLTENIIAGLPGKMTDSYSLESFREQLAQYQAINSDELRANFLKFLEFILPLAEQHGVKLAIHPDDPPRDMFGLPRIHFFHLRGVSRDPSEPRSFYEANHLDSDIDMVGVIQNLLLEEKKRRANGEPDNEIFIRPDHGHQMMGDIQKQNNPGYSGVGRFKGLAEIRGVIRALSAKL